MAGNVWEWVADGWNPEAYKRGDVENPFVEPSGGHGVLRGGSWDFAASRLTTTFRQKYTHDAGHVSAGIRCVKDAGGGPVEEPQEGASEADAPKQPSTAGLCASMSERMDEVEQFGRDLAGILPAFQKMNQESRGKGPLEGLRNFETMAKKTKAAGESVRVAEKAVKTMSLLPGEEPIRTELLKAYDATATAFETYSTQFGLRTRGVEGIIGISELAKDMPDLNKKLRKELLMMCAKLNSGSGAKP